MHNAAQATAAWQALLAQRTRKPPRAGRPQEAVPAIEGLERAGVVLRLAEQVGRAGSRAGAAGGDRGRCGARRPVEQDRRALSRSPEQGGSGPEGLREGAVLRRPEPGGGAGADPALREGEGDQAARRGAARRARSRDRRRRAPPAHAAAGRPAGHGRGRQARRPAHRPAGAGGEPGRRLGDQDLAAAGGGERRMAGAGRGLRGGGAAGRGRVGPGGDAGAARHRGRRLRARAGQPRAGDRAQPEDPGPLRQGYRTRWRRWSASTSPPVASGICSPSTTRSSRWRRARRRRWRSASSSPASTRDEIKQPDKAIDLYWRSSGRTRSSCPRWRRWIGCISSSVAGRTWRRRSPRRSICRPTWPPSRS